MMNEIGAEPFFEYARERYSIYLRKINGQRRPWTNDPILQDYRFCNVFREDDKTTRWIKEHVRDRFENWDVVFAITMARWFNRIETLERLDPSMFSPDTYRSDAVYERLRNVKPIITAAYIIKTPNGMNKLNGVLACIEWFRHHWWMEKGRIEKTKTAIHTLQGFNKWLQGSPYLGPFMAYEIVTDLRHTPVLSHAPDIFLWANAGPGAARGAGRVIHNNPEMFNRHKKQDQKIISDLMLHLLNLSTLSTYWPANWPKWEMREVEHTLCEFDKYERARLGEGKPKQLYKVGG